MYKVYEIKQRVFADNDLEADKVRTELKKDKTFLLNLMSSPGAGKTTTLTKTIDAMKHDFRIGVMEADIDSAVDADTSQSHSAAHRGNVSSGCRYDKARAFGAGYQ